jgi:hypothetical protein
LWYCGLAIFAVLVLLGNHQPLYLIAAIVVVSALLIYFLKPHPLARKRRVLVAVFGPIVALVVVVSVSVWGWTAYVESEQRKAAVNAILSEASPENLPRGLRPEILRRWLEDNPGATLQDGVRAYLTVEAKKTGRSLEQVIKDAFSLPKNLPEGLTPEKLLAWLQDNLGATPADGVRDYHRFQEEKRDEARRQAEEARRREDAAPKENARIDGRLKIGDRVSAINDGRIALYSGVYSEKKPRLYGTVMDVEFDPKNQQSERYAIKWDGGNLVWIDGRHDLRRTPK